MLFVTLVFFSGWCSAIHGRPIPLDEKLSGRSPLGSPAAATAETALQFLLRNDQDMCLLKLVCSAGANVSRYGVYADSIATSLGYKYQPFDFSVVRSPNIADQLNIVGRAAHIDFEEDLATTQQNDGSLFIRAPKFNYKQDFTWVVKITPTSTVYVKKPITSGRPTPIQRKTLPFVKSASAGVVGKLSFPVVKSSAAQNFQKPAAPLFKEIEKSVSVVISKRSAPANAIAVEFGNWASLFNAEVHNATAKNDYSDETTVMEDNLSIASEIANKNMGASDQHMLNSSAITLDDLTSDSAAGNNTELEDTVEPEERSGFPATYVFNRAFVLGLRSGPEACSTTFGECPMNVDRIIRFGSNLFMSPTGV